MKHISPPLNLKHYFSLHSFLDPDKYGLESKYYNYYHKPITTTHYVKIL